MKSKTPFTTTIATTLAIGSTLVTTVQPVKAQIYNYQDWQFIESSRELMDHEFSKEVWDDQDDYSLSVKLAKQVCEVLDTGVSKERMREIRFKSLWKYRNSQNYAYVKDIDIATYVAGIGTYCPMYLN